MKKNIEATHVIIGGIVFPWATKAPYVESGRSALGALEYNQERNLIKCHICGEWFAHLSKHLSKSEGVTADEYRASHGLRTQNPLSRPVPKTRSTRPPGNYHRGRLLSKRKPRRPNIDKPRRPGGGNDAETKNLKMLCQAQIRVRLADLVRRLGRRPTLIEMRAENLNTTPVKTALGCQTMGGVWENLGLPKGRYMKTRDGKLLFIEGRPGKGGRKGRKWREAGCN